MARHANPRPRWQLRATIALAITGAVIASGTIGYAASSGGQVQACYDNTTGALRVVGSTPCSGSETAIDWAKTGPPGISTLYHSFRSSRVAVPGTQRPVAIATTPVLAAGAYEVTASGHFSRPGNAAVSCFFSPAVHVGIRTIKIPHHEEIVLDSRAELVTQTDYVKAMKAGQRITWYCQSGFDPGEQEFQVSEGRLDHRSIDAVPVDAIHASVKN